MPKLLSINIKDSYCLYNSPKVQIWFDGNIYYLKIQGKKGLKQYFDADEAIIEAIRISDETNH